MSESIEKLAAILEYSSIWKEGKRIAIQPSTDTGLGELYALLVKVRSQDQNKREKEGCPGDTPAWAQLDARRIALDHLTEAFKEYMGRVMDLAQEGSKYDDRAAQERADKG